MKTSRTFTMKTSRTFTEWSDLTPEQRARTVGPRHEPTDECDGKSMGRLVGAARVGTRTCIECFVNLCPCEAAYGHDCE